MWLFVCTQFLGKYLDFFPVAAVERNSVGVVKHGDLDPVERHSLRVGAAVERHSVRVVSRHVGLCVTSVQRAGITRCTEDVALLEMVVLGSAENQISPPCCVSHE